MDGRSHLEDRNVPILTRFNSALVRFNKHGYGLPVHFYVRPEETWPEEY